jgi:MFS family permease
VALFSLPGAARVLAVSTLVQTVGRGVWLTVSTIFLTRAVGLTVTEVGVGLTIAGLISLLASAPLGYLADRCGAHHVQMGALLANAGLTAALVTVRSFPMFLLAAGALALADAALRAARGAVIAGALPPQERVRTRAYLRATTNVGISLGAVLAGIGLAVDTRAGYVTLILADAACFLGAAAVLTRLAPIPRVPAPTRGPRLIALRDRPFLAFSALDGLMSMHFSLINIALPLWIVGHTAAPAWMISVLLVVNTVMVIIFQVRAARGTEDLGVAARVGRRAGLVIGAACLLFAASGAVPIWASVGLLLLGALVHVLGELWQSAAGWGISFGLAPANAQGQYQGTYAMGGQLGGTLAPVVLTTLALGWGIPGWVLLGLLFAGLGALLPPVVRWAVRTRPVGANPDPVAAVPTAGSLTG